MRDLWADGRSAGRTLLREPGFAAVALLTLAVGIGANTAIFSIVNSVLLRPLAYRDPDRLVVVREVVPAISHLYPTLPVNVRHLLEWRKQCSSFEGLAAIRPMTLSLTGAGEPEQLGTARVSASLFPLLGVQPRLGRGFLPEEDQPGRERVVILSDSLWRRRFHSDPSLIGKTIALDGAPHVVAGILPSSFRFPVRDTFEIGQTLGQRTDVFRPAAFTRDDMEALMGDFNWAAIGRLKPGVTPEKALAELNVVETNLAKLVPEKTDLRAWIAPLQEQVVGRVRRGLLVLLGAVGAVLLIVCVNLANLLLARAERRSRESAVRSALGAGRGRLMRQALAEALLIAVAGGALGIAVAAGGLNVLVKNAPVDLPRLDEVRLDWQVLAFALAISTATGLLFGCLPAWRVARTDPQQVLKSGGRTASEGARGVRLRSVLVGVEVGLGALLLITAGLLMTSFLRLMRVDKGFQAGSVLAADVRLSPVKYAKREQLAAFYDRVLARLVSQPGVLSAGLVSALPLQGETWVDGIAVEGDARPLLERPLANVRFVSPDYFRTMGIPFRRGRPFAESDRTRTVALISERMAERLWPGQDPIGRRFSRGDEKKFEVIGVVGDVRATADRPPVPIVYLPYWDRARLKATLVARTALSDPRSIAGAMRAAVWGADPEVPISEMQTLEEVLEDSVAQRRFQMLLATGFAAAALLLASLGIYGVVSYTVARRANEMGIRMALGARPSDLHRMVLRQGMAPVLLGLAAGTAAALAFGRILRSLLFEVSARDPATIAAVAGVLALVGAAACYLPARRATRADPLAALRYE